jgi:hypothetical protein
VLQDTIGKSNCTAPSFTSVPTPPKLDDASRVPAVTAPDIRFVTDPREGLDLL